MKKFSLLTVYVFLFMASALADELPGAAKEKYSQKEISKVMKMLKADTSPLGAGLRATLKSLTVNKFHAFGPLSFEEKSGTSEFSISLNLGQCPDEATHEVDFRLVVRSEVYEFGYAVTGYEVKIGGESSDHSQESFCKKK